MIIYIHCIFTAFAHNDFILFAYSIILTILIIPEQQLPLYSAFEQVLLPGYMALYKFLHYKFIIIIIIFAIKLLLDINQ